MCNLKTPRQTSYKQCPSCRSIFVDYVTGTISEPSWKYTGYPDIMFKEKDIKNNKTILVFRCNRCSYKFEEIFDDGCN